MVRTKKQAASKEGKKSSGKKGLGATPDHLTDPLAGLGGGQELIDAQSGAHSAIAQGASEIDPLGGTAVFDTTGPKALWDNITGGNKKKKQ